MHLTATTPEAASCLESALKEVQFLLILLSWDTQKMPLPPEREKTMAGIGTFCCPSYTQALSLLPSYCRNRKQRTKKAGRLLGMNSSPLLFQTQAKLHKIFDPRQPLAFLAVLICLKAQQTHSHPCTKRISKQREKVEISHFSFLCQVPDLLGEKDVNCLFSVLPSHCTLKKSQSPCPGCEISPLVVSLEPIKAQ